MNPDKHTPWRDVLKVAGLTLAVMVAMPAIAVLLFFARAALLFVLLAAVAAGLVAFVLSPRFRGWLRYVGEPVIAYKGLELATDVALAPGHVWARVSGDEALVGADDLMQAALGPVDAVELPPVGRRVQAGEPLFRLRNGKRTLSGRAPVGGIVVAVNDALREDPRRVNNTPFTDGWTVRVASQDMRRERHGLRRGMSARDLFRREVDRMLGVVAAAEGVPVLADGGEVVAEIHRHIDDETWNRLRAAVFAETAGTADAA